MLTEREGLHLQDIMWLLSGKTRIFEAPLRDQKRERERKTALELDGGFTARRNFSVPTREENLLKNHQSLHRVLVPTDFKFSFMVSGRWRSDRIQSGSKGGASTLLEILPWKRWGRLARLCGGCSRRCGGGSKHYHWWHSSPISHQSLDGLRDSYRSQCSSRTVSSPDCCCFNNWPVQNFTLFQILPLLKLTKDCKVARCTSFCTSYLRIFQTQGANKSGIAAWHLYAWSRRRSHVLRATEWAILIGYLSVSLVHSCSITLFKENQICLATAAFLLLAAKPSWVIVVLIQHWSWSLGCG